ncbi:MAG TPA: class I poly(R)-hydroxyalkanoic acid synthase, partial [Burkholderiales bacterium]|nr:class I poly(R)-hydroxyalkanoic acid synthase [Burkholderiales bacterium]
HIVPWKTAYASAQLLSGTVDFVLGASGHVAGVVNPAWKDRRSYWLNDTLDVHPDGWLANAAVHPGSWWTHWSRWIEAHSGRRVPARLRPGGNVCDEIEPAPGRYVTEKAGLPRSA